MSVESSEGISCHTGRESCFYRILENDCWQDVDPVLKLPEEMYEELKDNE